MPAILSLCALPFAVGLAGTLLFEALLSPRPTPVWRRSLAANTVHLASWLLLFGLFTLVLQRAWFAVVVILALQLVVVQSSNTKSRTLNEPFICHDFEYFWDAILHPRLYVPFFGIGLAIAASSAGAVAIGSFFYFEPSLVSHVGASSFLLMNGMLIALGAILITLGWRALPALTLAPKQDLHRLGLHASLWGYGIDLMRSSPPSPSQSPYYAVAHQGTAVAAADLANVVLIQSESFFDPRPWNAEVAPGVLAHFDETFAEAELKGALSVPAWGANTVRTECSMLTGLPPDAWGALQFNPYRTLARHSLPSLASALKAQGYRTVCIHPYLGSFYMRDRVMQRLGFDELIDIASFTSEDKQGQYIGDRAVAREIGKRLSESDGKPLFIFVITMENHGPLHLEPPRQADAQQWLPTAGWPLAPHQRDLAVYLQHLAEADQMVSSVKKALNSADRSGLLGWYGDHVPILPEAYAHYGQPTGDTPYMIWSTESLSTESSSKESSPLAPHQREHTPMAASDLGVQLFIKATRLPLRNDMIKAEPGFQEQE